MMSTSVLSAISPPNRTSRKTLLSKGGHIRFTNWHSRSTSSTTDDRNSAHLNTEICSQDRTDGRLYDPHGYRNEVDSRIVASKDSLGVRLVVESCPAYWCATYDSTSLLSPKCLTRKPKLVICFP